MAGSDLDQLSPEARRRMIAALEQRQAARAAAGAPGAASASAQRSGALPLSPYQQRMWLLHRLGIDSAANHVSVALRLTGALDGAAIERAVGDLLQRHEALRVAITDAKGDGQPEQSVRPLVAAPLTWIDREARSAAVIDLRQHGGDEPERALERLFIDLNALPFDLGAGPLFRAACIRLGDTTHVLVLTFHHIVADMWSAWVFVRELVVAYEARARGAAPVLPALPLDYRQLIEWQRERLSGPRLAALQSYWAGRLGGRLPPSSFQTDHQRPALSLHRGARCPFVVQPALRGALEALARRQRTTLFTVLLAAWDALIAHRSGDEDLAVFVPSANRGRRDAEGMIAQCANIVPLRADLSGDPSFIDLLARLRVTAFADLAHGELPFSTQLDQLDLARERPAAQIFFNLLPPPPVLALPGSALQVDLLRPDWGVAGFDLQLFLYEAADRLEGLLEFDTALFEPATAAALAADYRQLLERIAAAPEQRLSAVTAALPARRLSLAIAATFTAEPIAESLAYWSGEIGAPATIRFAPFNQVHQQLLDGASVLGRNAGGFNILLVRLEDWLVGESRGVAAPPSPPEIERLAGSVRELIGALTAAVARGAVPHLLVLCPASPRTRAVPERAAALAAAEAALEAGLAASPGVHLVRDGLGEAPPFRCDDEAGDELGRVPYTPAYFAALGTAVARRIDAARRPPYKVIVTDCDDTLWGGIVGEVGLQGLVIDGPRRRLQELLLARQRAGVLLCLASKNNAADVFEVLDHHPDMLLRREHFVAASVHWGPKCDSLAALAAELGLGLDSFVFLDDSPLECAEMRAIRPEVLTLQLPREAARIPSFLRHAWVFDGSGERVSEEDRGRTEQYRQQAERERLRQGSATLGEFLDRLGLEAAISPMAEAEVERVAQLLQRTSQFNFTTRRRTELELRQLASGGAVELCVVRVTDRFGDYGLTGAAFFSASGDAIRIDTLLLSCRVLGRGVEHRLLAHLAGLAQARRLGFIEAPFVPSAKNRPAREFLEGLPAARRREGDTEWFRLPAAAALALRPTAGTGQHKGGAGPPPAPQPAPAGRLSSMTAQRIADGLGDPLQLHAVLEARRPRRASRAQAYAAPRTATEARVVALWEEALRIERIGIADDFFALGGDSLLATRLLSRLREEFQVPLVLRALFDSPTPARLAALLDHQGAPADDGAAAPDLRAEAVLAADIAAALATARDGGAARAGRRPPRRVLLTGSSGFLGVHLLDRLDALGAQVCCLVRAGSPAAALQRLRAALAAQGLPVALADRAVPVPGDLAQPWLGLQREEFDALGAGLDAIYHNGAALSDVAPYRLLKAANVGGTEWVLRLAARAATPVHYVSTLALLDAPGVDPQLPRDEGFDIGLTAAVAGGYLQTKWVAEQLVWQAGRLGLPVSVYRPGLISGDSRTGACASSDLFSSLLAGIIALGAYPELADDPGEITLPLTPVDFTAAAIARLSLLPAAQGRALHVCPPEQMALDDLWAHVRGEGYPLTQVPFEDWLERLEAASAANDLGPFLGALEHGPGGAPPRFACHETHRALLLDGEVTCPALDRRLIALYLAHLRRAGRLAPAPAVKTTQD